MVGVMGIVFLLLPESPWWLVSKGKLEKGSKMLSRYQGHLQGYSVEEEVVSMIPNRIVWIVSDTSMNIGHHDSYTGRSQAHRQTSRTRRSIGSIQGKQLTPSVHCFLAENDSAIRWVRSYQLPLYAESLRSFINSLSVFNTYATYFCKLNHRLALFPLSLHGNHPSIRNR